MTDRPPLRPICLIGPPAAGKTTLAEAISRAIDIPVLRPRDLIHRAIGRHPAIISLFPRDARGWVPEESLGLALRICLDRLGGTVIFENQPWDAVQLADLYRACGDRILLLHLRASDILVTERRGRRRYCASCYPRHAISTNGLQCGRCGKVLTARSDDEHAAFAERLRLHRINTAKMITLGESLGINIVDLDAARSPGALRSQVLTIVGPTEDRLVA